MKMCHKQGWFDTLIATVLPVLTGFHDKLLPEKGSGCR